MAREARQWRTAMSGCAPDLGDNLTRVHLTWLEGRVEHWIRFGAIAQETLLDRRRRIVAFAPGAIFAFVRWASNDFGTVVSRLDVVRAAVPGEAYSTLPHVRPGGDILLRQTGWPKVQRVLAAIDAIEALGLTPAAGAHRLADLPWKSSALRDTTLRLARDGEALVAGGYRRLLRPSRISR